MKSDRLKRTALHDRHVALGATMVDFAGWHMPVQYESIIDEHLATRAKAGLFDVSHMGRFVIRGKGALPFLRYALTNDASRLVVGRAQYTIMAAKNGGAIDDAYLHCIAEDEYLLVVNAANRDADREHLNSLLPEFQGARIIDRSDELSMLSLQGPVSEEIVSGLLTSGAMPEAGWNTLGVAEIVGRRVTLARTGYTGERVGFDIFVETPDAARLWDALAAGGAVPAGLGARDTLRLEAGLPLYGHELGLDRERRDVPVFACPSSKVAVSFADTERNFVGRKALERQYEALRKIAAGDCSAAEALPQIVMPLAVAGRSITRRGARVLLRDGKAAGRVTSGSVAPYLDGKGRTALRVVCLALLDSELKVGRKLDIDIRGARTDAVIVPAHLRRRASKVKPVIYDFEAGD